MALIKCPECGKERVSDLAEMCPECGFPIKSYYKSKKTSETEKPNDIDKKDTQEKDEDVEQDFTDYLIDTKDIYKPKKPAILSVISEDIFMGVLGVFTFSIFAWFFHDISEFLSTIFILIVIGYGIGYTVSGICNYSKAIGVYRKKLELWEEDATTFLAEEMNRCAEEQMEEQERIYKELTRSFQPSCPHCGSTSFTPVRKKWDIVTGYRTNKIELICNNCGYKIDERK